MNGQRVHQRRTAHNLHTSPKKNDFVVTEIRCDFVINTLTEAQRKFLQLSQNDYRFASDETTPFILLFFLFFPHDFHSNLPALDFAIKVLRCLSLTPGVSLLLLLSCLRCCCPLQLVRCEHHLIPSSPHSRCC
jgi:hypothetical protein